MNFLKIYIFIIFLCIFPQLLLNCSLAGYPSGKCQNAKLISSSAPFCSGYTTKFVCAPIEYTLWKNDYNIMKRDLTIQSFFIKNIEKILIQIFEANAIDYQSLLDSTNCYEKYKQFVCSFNFPPCNFEGCFFVILIKFAHFVYLEDQTIPLCESKCLDYVEACGLNSDLCVINFAEIQPGLNQTKECSIQ